MVIPKENPFGIDKVIDNIQRKVYKNLECNFNDLEMYGRVYKNVDERGNISLERYWREGEYKKVLFSEGNKVFFVQGNSPVINLGQASNDLWMVCVFKLMDDEERKDEEAHGLVTQELIKVLGLNAVKSLEYGMNNLRRVVEDPFEFGNFKFSDIHPYHVFMVKLRVDYQIINNEC